MKAADFLSRYESQVKNALSIIARGEQNGDESEEHVGLIETDDFYKNNSDEINACIRWMSTSEPPYFVFGGQDVSASVAYLLVGGWLASQVHNGRARKVAEQATGLSVDFDETGLSQLVAALNEKLFAPRADTSTPEGAMAAAKSRADQQQLSWARDRLQSVLDGWRKKAAREAEEAAARGKITPSTLEKQLTALPASQSVVPTVDPRRTQLEADIESVKADLAAATRPSAKAALEADLADLEKQLTAL